MKKFEKKQIVLIVLCFVCLMGIIASTRLFPEVDFDLEKAYAISITGGANGPTTIYISNDYNSITIITIIMLLSAFIAIDMLILSLIKKIENQKFINTRYIILIAINVFIAIVLIPEMLIFPIAYNLIIVFIVAGKYVFQKYLRRRKDNTQ